jgi:hypothetical protein
MLNKIIAAFFLLSPITLWAQEEAVTSDGKVVLLYPDSTWKLKVIASISSDSTFTDTLTTPKPVRELPKEYAEVSTGFKGFLKPELKVPKLPEISQGVYEFRVKVNKEGFVKEVVTLQRGVNGQAETMMRQAITRMKFLPDGSITPPLTEGIIKLTVAEK